MHIAPCTKASSSSSGGVLSQNYFYFVKGQFPCKYDPFNAQAMVEGRAFVVHAVCLRAQVVFHIRSLSHRFKQNPNVANYKSIHSQSRKVPDIFAKPLKILTVRNNVKRSICLYTLSCATLTPIANSSSEKLSEKARRFNAGPPKYTLSAPKRSAIFNFSHIPRRGDNLKFIQSLLSSHYFWVLSYSTQSGLYFATSASCSLSVFWKESSPVLGSFRQKNMYPAFIIASSG